MEKIGTSTRVYEIMQRYPETVDYFLELGVCGCSFGEAAGKRSVELTLEELAREKGFSPEKLLEELKALVE